MGNPSLLVLFIGMWGKTTFMKAPLVILSKCKICKLISQAFSRGNNCANINCFCTNMLIALQFITVLLKIMDNFKKRHQYPPMENSESATVHINNGVACGQIQSTRYTSFIDMEMHLIVHWIEKNYNEAWLCNSFMWNCVSVCIQVCIHVWVIWTTCTQSSSYRKIPC